MQGVRRASEVRWRVVAAGELRHMMPTLLLLLHLLHLLLILHLHESPARVAVQGVPFALTGTCWQEGGSASGADGVCERNGRHSRAGALSPTGVARVP